MSYSANPYYYFDGEYRFSRIENLPSSVDDVQRKSKWFLRFRA